MMIDYNYETIVGGDPVEAYKLSAANVKKLSEWCNGAAIIEYDALDPQKMYPGINVPTPLGPRRAQEGDYILQYANDGSFMTYIDSHFHYAFQPRTNKSNSSL